MTILSIGNTALHYACRGGRNQIIYILIRSGASLAIPNQSGHTPLFMAVIVNHAFCMSFTRCT